MGNFIPQIQISQKAKTQCFFSKVFLFMSTSSYSKQRIKVTYTNSQEQVKQNHLGIWTSCFAGVSLVFYGSRFSSNSKTVSIKSSYWTVSLDAAYLKMNTSPFRSFWFKMTITLLDFRSDHQAGNSWRAFVPKNIHAALSILARSRRLSFSHGAYGPFPTPMSELLCLGFCSWTNSKVLWVLLANKSLWPRPLKHPFGRKYFFSRLQISCCLPSVFRDSLTRRVGGPAAIWHLLRRWSGARKTKSKTRCA